MKWIHTKDTVNKTPLGGTTHTHPTIHSTFCFSEKCITVISANVANFPPTAIKNKFTKQKKKREAKRNISFFVFPAACVATYT